MSAYLLGIDTGVSKSAVALSTPGGQLLGTARGPGMMLFGPPSEDQSRTLRDLVDQVCAHAAVAAQEIGSIGAGMCGVDFPKELDGQHRGLCEGLGVPPESTVLVNDAVVALWGATDAPRAVIIQQGSAYTSAYRNAIGHEQVFDPFDHARPFDLRRESLARVVRMLDGRATRTGFATLFLDHVGVDDLDELNELMAAPGKKGWEKVSTVAAVLSSAWLDGDPAASEMIEALVEDLAVTVRAMAGRIGPGPFEVALGGGVLKRLAPAFFELVGTRLTALCPGAKVVDVALPPEQGALVMAGHHAGGSSKRLFAALVDRDRSLDRPLSE